MRVDDIVKKALAQAAGNLLKESGVDGGARSRVAELAYGHIPEQFGSIDDFNDVAEFLGHQSASQLIQIGMPENAEKIVDLLVASLSEDEVRQILSNSLDDLKPRTSRAAAPTSTEMPAR